MLTLEEKKNFVSYENLPLNGRIPAVLSDQLSKRWASLERWTDCAFGRNARVLCVECGERVSENRWNARMWWSSIISHLYSTKKKCATQCCRKFWVAFTAKKNMFQNKIPNTATTDKKLSANGKYSLNEFLTQLCLQPLICSKKAVINVGVPEHCTPYCYADCNDSTAH